MDKLHIDSWWWKIAIVLALVGIRAFVGLTSKESAAAKGGRVKGPLGAPPVKTPEPDDSRWVIETLDSAAIAIGLVLFIIQPFLLQAFYIPSGSMEDTLRINDRLLVSKLAYRVREPRAGDVVVFVPPPEADADTGDDYIKRCMGAPGDIIYADSGRHYYRQTGGDKKPLLLAEPYVKWHEPDDSYDMKIVGGKLYTRESSTSSFSFNRSAGEWKQAGHHELYERAAAPNQSAIDNAPPEAVPDGMFLMLGDHRDNSKDSHVWGFVPRANIVGKAFTVFWPPSRVGAIDRMTKYPRPRPSEPAIEPISP